MIEWKNVVCVVQGNAESTIERERERERERFCPLALSNLLGTPGMVYAPALLFGRQWLVKFVSCVTYRLLEFALPFPHLCVSMTRRICIGQQGV